MIEIIFEAPHLIQEEESVALAIKDFLKKKGFREVKARNESDNSDLVPEPPEDKENIDNIKGHCPVIISVK